MHCDRFRMPDGTVVIVCSRKRLKSPKCFCGCLSKFQCDARLKGQNGKTCDRHLCSKHATEVGEDKHLCPNHLQRWQEKQRQKELAL